MLLGVGVPPSSQARLGAASVEGWTPQAAGTEHGNDAGGGRPMDEGGTTGRNAVGSAVKQAGLVLRAYRTESAIYGVVLVSALIAIGWEDDTDLEVLLFTLGTTAVFWLAHVYAGTIAREEGPESGRPR